MPCGRFGGACAPFAPPWVRHCTQWAFCAKMTSYPRRCDVITSHRRGYDVILSPNAYWVNTVVSNSMVAMVTDL